MEANQSHEEDNEEMINMNIKQFIEATRQYLFQLAIPQTQQVLATIPVSTKR